jgi:hypothetical protein
LKPVSARPSSVNKVSLFSKKQLDEDMNKK